MEKILKIYQPPPPTSERFRRAAAETLKILKNFSRRRRQTHRLTPLFVEKVNDSLIICDRGNRRVVRWSRRNNTRGETIISDIHCSRLSMDKNGSLYVSDSNLFGGYTFLG